MKDFWKKYGRWITLVLLIIVLIMVGVLLAEQLWDANNQADSLRNALR